MCKDTNNFIITHRIIKNLTMVKSLFLMVLLLNIAACSQKYEQDTLINDQPPTASHSDIGTDGRLAVFVSEQLAADIDSNAATLPDGITFTKAFTGDPAFDARHRAAGLHRWYYADYQPEIPRTKALGDIRKIEGIDYMETLPAAELNSIPFNDPNVSFQWHLYNSGTIVNGAVNGCDINVVPVWEQFTAGCQEVIVGVVDSGIQYDHPDLYGIVIPPGADGSRSFLSSTSGHPYDYTPQRHGTHVAGVIAAINNNGVGGCGIAGGSNGTGGVRILDCQAIVTDENDTGDVYSAIVWAADHGAVLLNNSWNSSYDSIDKVPDTTPYYYRTVIDYFVNHAGTDSNGNQTGPMKGGVVFFSAGNKEWNKSQPSMYEKVIAVGATGPAGESSAYTNYGDWVDICAPGGNYSPYSSYNAIIYSTVSGNGYAQMQGTSQAAPMATGVAALLVSHFGGPGFTNSDLKDLLLGGADKETPHKRDIGPTLDAYESFVFKTQTMDSVTDMTASTDKSSATLKWSVGKCGEKYYYAYKVYVANSESQLKGISPFSTPSVLFERTIPMSSVLGSSVSSTFDKLDTCRNYYATAIGYSRSHHYNPDNKVICFRINGSPSVKRIGSGPIQLNHNKQIDIPVVYSDPDGDDLSITLDPGSTACTWTDDGKGNINLHIDASAAAPGYYFVIIKVDDGQKTSRLELKYTINQNSPVKKEEPSIQDIIIKARSYYSLDLSEYFTDADSDPIRYTVNCSNPDIQAVVSEATLSIQGSVFAIGEISLTAGDGYSDPVSHSFRVRIQDDDSGICVSSTVVSDQLLVSCGEPGQAKVTIYGKTGRRVYSKSVYQAPFSPCSIDVSGLAPGAYTVMIEFGNKTRKLTIVKI